MPAMLATCKDSMSPGPSPAGTYDLETINGEPLPCEILGTETLSATVTLKTDHTYSSETRERTIDLDGEVTTETSRETGTWSQDGSTLVIDPSDEDPSEAQLDGRMLTVDSGLFIAVYRKR